ncbi:MAG: 3-dehydroquinate synthase [Eubacteriales bacterium]|jgi:3-dehydroquinate synthase|nr:3-dehydroquinate synthase [Eubacteriales bacterium]
MSEIIIRRGILDDLGRTAFENGHRGMVCVISDDTVMGLYGNKAVRSLEVHGFTVVSFSFTAGEQSKNIHTYFDILNFLAENELTRTDTVIALGGGVTGDVAGFAAATYLRGVKLIQVPTTLLAMVDSSIGGKTAIDLPAGKNMAGAFYQPDIVLIDPDTLSTLPTDTFRDGSAEVIKYAALSGRDLLSLLPLKPETADHVITRCADIKKSIVLRDEKDRGERQLLNFGHTFGHAAEKLSGYTLSHGRAVALGMAITARACVRKGLCPAEDGNLLLGTIRACGLPTTTPLGPDRLFDAMQGDKKRGDGGITLALLHAIGDVRLHKTTMETAKEYLFEGWEA